MKKDNYLLRAIIMFLFMFPGIIFSQATSPFSLSTKWYFGNFGGIDFSSGVPAVLTGGKVDSWGQEGSSTITDASGDVVFYTDGYELYDGNHNFIQYVRGGTSSTQNSVAIPDPADPENKFYLFTANVEPSSGGQRVGSVAELGINYYHIKKTAGTISVIAGPVQIAGPTEVSEQLCSGTDLKGNYWVVAHEGGDWTGWDMRDIYSWHVTSAGVSSRISSSVSTATGNNPWLGSMKINKCQTRLAAVHESGSVEVFEWDATTGKVTGLIHRSTGFPALYGCEFSPNGNVLYFTSASGDKLYQLDILSGTIYTEAEWKSVNNTPWMGTLQLGPDGKIYVTNGNHAGSPGGTPAYIGVINYPDVAGAGCNYDNKGFLLNAGPVVHPNIERGISNISWLAPKCNMGIVDECPLFKFSYDVKNHFNENVSVIPGSEEWNFGEGNGFETGLGPDPQYNFTQGGLHMVKLRFKDQTCGRLWEFGSEVNVNCVLPVNWLSFDAEKEGAVVLLRWATASEVNNRDFTVERSTDGISFEPIATIPAVGNSATVNTYEFRDMQPVYTGSYYRIRQNDYSGEFNYSSVQWVEDNLQVISVLPNPSADEFSLTAPLDLEGMVLVMDALGREVYRSPYVPGMTFGREFSAGYYIIKVINDHFAWSAKVIKEL